jgi:hypothetical protein
MSSRSGTHLALASLALFAMPITAFAAAEPAAKNKDYYTKKTCSVDLATGSRLGGVRRCRTKAEKDQARAEDRQVVERIQSQKVTMCPPMC